MTSSRLIISASALALVLSTLACSGGGSSSGGSSGSTCGNGTTEVDGTCVPTNTITCGTGTVEMNGTCVPVSTITCGTGTVEMNGACVPVSTITCGTGTVEMNGACVPVSTITCGPGTVEMNGACVPASTTTCGTGTALMNGECLPDGSVICDQGTAFSMAAGRCVLDPSACAQGTVLLGGVCAPEDAALTADVDEAAEPNDMTGAGMVDAPAMGAMTTLHGCITPVTGQRDVDPWVVNITAPTVLEITADGVGGLAAGFTVGAAGIAELPDFTRWGINLAGDTSKRQVFFPLPGAYVMQIDDSRTLLTGEAAGNAETCYYVTLNQVALPVPVPAMLPQSTGMDSGSVTVFSVTPGGTGHIIDILQQTASTAMVPAFVVRKNGTFFAAVAFDPNTNTPPFSTVGAVDAADTVEIIVDNVYNLSLTPQNYTVDLFDIPGVALPRDGSAVTLTNHIGENPAAPYVDSSYLYFDVGAAGEILEFDLTSTSSASMNIVRTNIFNAAGNLDVVASLPTGTAFQGRYVRFAAAGRYYLVLRDNAGMAMDMFDVTCTLTITPVTPLVANVPLTAQPFPASGSTFYSIDPAGLPWVELLATVADWGDPANTVNIGLLDLAGEGYVSATTGSPGATYTFLQTVAQPSAGLAQLGRITMGDARAYLVRIDNSGTPGAAPMMDLLFQERAHVDLGAVAPASPIVRTNTDTTPPGGMTRYLITGTAGHRLQAEVTGLSATSDIRIDRRTATELIPAAGGTFDAGGPGAPETLTAVFGADPNWIAFTVTSTDLVDTNLSLNLTAAAPLPFVDICSPATVLAAPFDGTADDELSPVQTLPPGFGFVFFGVPQTEFIIAANGLLAFGNVSPSCSFGCYANNTIPNPSAPNDFIAAYWDDLEHMKLCRLDEADKVTIQWEGDLYGASTAVVQVQAVLNTNGRIDLIYGPLQQANAASATIGAEDATGAVGVLMSFNTLSAAPANSSYSFTTP